MNVAPVLVAVAYAGFVAAGVALAVIDIRHRRLPDAVVLPSLLAVAAPLTAAALLDGEWDRVVSTLGAAAGLFALYLLLALLNPAGLGAGDVKLAALVGAALGYAGWGVVAVGAVAGFLLAALAGLTVLLVRRNRRTDLPFGPFMLGGAWIGLAWAAILLGRS